MGKWVNCVKMPRRSLERIIENSGKNGQITETDVRSNHDPVHIGGLIFSVSSTEHCCMDIILVETEL